ncbi:manganese-dependent inorganic pyrophosphatase [Sodalis sp. dw_96]|uniref:manganese-dependent inorganic pyrophosphatase n=1 Tax=Sodalis sp. dw_96 TaxID=2719794 RepID=UPI001BD27093|nr:manganese-dependent inorganic pyrophosphatase [Sodalis sp. dw_96]
MLYVFGHKNPDSDTICSAIIAADWLRHLGKKATPFRLGETNTETHYILSQAGVAAPELLECSVASKDVWLVDFTDTEQGPDSLVDSNVIGIIDHHRLGTLTTRNPPDAWIRSLGSCATVLWHIITTESDMPFTSSQATLLLGAILSDTVSLTSPTTTDRDRQAVEALFSLTSLDRERFCRELLEAKTDITGLSAVQLMNKDAKRYRINGHEFLLAQLELNAMSQLDALMPALMTELDALCHNDHLDVVVLMATDIIRKKTTLWFSKNSLAGMQRPVSMPGVLSRKKQVLPWLTEQLTKDKT